MSCGTAPPSVVYTNAGSTNYTIVPECIVCTATTVAQIIEGQQNITQTNTLTLIGDNCDGMYICVRNGAKCVYGEKYVYTTDMNCVCMYVL